MGHRSKFSGAVIDQAIARAELIVDRINGWTKLPSAADAPVALNMLTALGNYTVDYWTGGPEINLTGPINLSVFNMNGAEKFQSVCHLNQWYLRAYNRNTSTYGAWTYKQVNTSTAINPTPPSNPDELTIWLDTNNTVNPVFKIFFNGEWVEIAPSEMMEKSVYDPNGQTKDIFAYIDESIANANIDSATADFETHVADTTIHTTAEEKAGWDAKPDMNAVNGKIATLQSELEADVLNQASGLSTEATAFKVTAEEYIGTLNTHLANATIHPTTAKQAEWDNKAASDHTHNLDGRVSLDASAIVDGTIDLARIDPSALERLVSVADDAARLKLTIDQVQNGDTVYVTTPPAIWFVVDDTKLSTGDTDAQESAFKLFSTGVTAMTWENVEEKPTTVAGFGITDVYTKTEVNTKIEPLQEFVTDNADTMAAVGNLAGKNYDGLVSDVQTASLKLDSLLTNQTAIEDSMTSIMQSVTSLKALLA